MIILDVIPVALYEYQKCIFSSLFSFLSNLKQPNRIVHINKHAIDLVNIIGKTFISIPYNIQTILENRKHKFVVIDISSALFLLYIFNNCGIIPKDAIIPIIVANDDKNVIFRVKNKKH